METQRRDLIYPQETYEIIGASMAVHNALGRGFTEKVYQEALAIEFQERGIPFQREIEIHAVYKGNTLSATFIPDFICYDKIIVELKAVKDLEDVYRAQALNYAKIAGFRLALLINFGESRLVAERLPILA
ncbi:MAG: GxxExxY protein [Bacteroidaceae bacterium]|nr:GxxExxY protein [Bacteroidaceae bacterium]